MNSSEGSLVACCKKLEVCWRQLRKDLGGRHIGDKCLI
jgi:hypothetical protein